MEASHPEIPLSTAESPPVVPATGFQRHDIRSIPFNRVGWLIFASIIVAVSSMGGGINLIVNSRLGWVNFAIIGAGFLVASIPAGLAIYWPRWEYNRASWRLDELGLQIRRGVIWRHQISIPIARVQHADVSQGPLQRRFGLGTLTIHTAGTQNAFVAIEGLAHETAIELRDKLVAQRKSGHVV